MDFPSDMLMDILSRLPAKSIIRFKSVAKSWSRLFKTSSFVSHHHNVSKNKQNNQLHFVHYFVFDQEIIGVLDLDDQTAPNLLHPLSGNIDYVCVDNGLVCFHSNSYPIFYTSIWNPATGESRIVPQLDDNEVTFWFGLDPSSNDYKVICIRRTKNDDHEYTVYHMSTDSWRVLTKKDTLLGNGIRIIHHSPRSTWVNGVLYLVVWVQDESKLSEIWILAFDLATEICGLIQSPTPLPTGEWPEMWMGIYSEWPKWQGMVLQLRDNRLGFWDSNVNAATYSLLVMNDDQKSWSILSKIEPCSRITILYGLWKNAKIFVKSLSEKVMVYDLETGEFMETGIPIKKSGTLIKTRQDTLWEIFQETLWEVFPYEETLVSVQREGE